MQFTWDANKAASNLSRHGVSFAEAVTVFEDANRVELSDTDNADGEPRMNVIGFSANAKLLFVVVLEVEDDELMRVISARPAAKHEVKLYAEENK